jgi:hypothetical protein
MQASGANLGSQRPPDSCDARPCPTVVSAVQWAHETTTTKSDDCLEPPEKRKVGHKMVNRDPDMLASDVLSDIRATLKRLTRAATQLCA